MNNVNGIMCLLSPQSLLTTIFSCLKEIKTCKKEKWEERSLYG